ncbi:MAG: Anaerobic magnesium-protoporphyrin IX monomethyl ester cyclase [Candidatus Omnitrophica bacterium]|nr:Anaerobic magnesium-protoporphyrin IX monomethyl ester cyclase [Candidatus Omnitrophota bacterium]
MKPSTPSSNIALSINGAVRPVERERAAVAGRIFLIYPPTGLYMRDDRCQAPVEGMTAQPNRAPLDLAYMAAMLERDGRTCKITDYAAEPGGWERVRRDIADFKPDLLLVSVTTPTLKNDLAACRIAKEIDPAILTVAKGAHFTAKDDEVLLANPELDLVIRGESEHAVTEIASGADYASILGLAYRKDGKVARNADRPYIEVDDLDKLPFPARHLINNALYTAPDTGEAITMINTGRGCPHQCIYCAVTIASGYKLKVRTPRSIVDEIQECVQKHGIRNFFFRADTFTWDERWVVDLCGMIRERGLDIRWGCNSRVDTISEKRLEAMKSAGCWIVGFGIESGDQDMLDKMKKRAKVEDAERAIALCKKYGVKTYGLFLIGLPWETRATVEKTIAFAKRLDPSFLDFNIAYPLPGTEYYRLAKEMGLFEEKDLPNGDYARPIVRTLDLSTEELVKLRHKALLSFYLRPSYIARTLGEIRSPRILLNYIRSGLRLIKHHAFDFGND